MKIAKLVLICGAILWASAVSAADRSIEDFYGEYAGRSVSGSADKLSTRDINVEIKSVRRGFNVSWSTVTFRKAGKASRKSYSIDFRRTKRGGIFQSAMRQDVFGNKMPNDPMRGDPYVWARIRGDTLSVYALIVTDDGSYDMQAYHRTLTPNGMALKFTRFLEGQEVKSISGELQRLK